ncbi:MAG TPA: hypothetical protein VN838_28665 [Bradyrhizobium sp.]|nr:hypothetical protein [Bradyrhizobium sp.]
MPYREHDDDGLMGHIFRELQKKQAEIASALATGFAPDHAAYRHEVGRHQGISDAMDLIDSAIRSYGAEDDGE